MRELFAALVCVLAVGCAGGEGGTEPLPLESKAHFMGVCGNDILEEMEQCDDGNVAPGDGCNATCALEDPRLAITEVMTDPEPQRDAFAEWFEVFNPTAHPINLRGWRLHQPSGRQKVVDQSVIVPAGGYVLLGRYAIPAINGGIILDYAYGATLSLPNGPGGIRLSDPLGNLIDTITWDGGAVWPNPRSNARALQLGSESDPGVVNNDDGKRWCFATTLMVNGMRGTPKAANTICKVPVCGDGKITGNEQCDDGGTVDGDGCSATCQLVPELAITEIMQDPASVSDAAGEWFEIYNPTIYATNLQGWTFTDESNDTFVVNASVVVPAMGYVVLGRSTDQGLNGGIAVNYGYGGGMALANGADKIVMRDAQNNEIDRVEWDNGNAWPNPASGGRASQFDPLFSALTDDNNDGSRWCLAFNVLPNTDRGTPGADNDPCDTPVCGDGVLGFGEACDDGGTENGDGCDDTCQLAPIVAITEVMSDPDQVPDGQGEWFELFNATQYDNDLEGWTFRDGAGESFTVEGSLILPANGYLVLGRYTDQGINGGVPVDYGYGIGMTLANGPDAIIVEDAEGAELDRVEWDGGAVWPDPVGEGSSSQFDINFDPVVDDNNDGTLWCRPTTAVGNGDFGTPGAANDPCPACGDGNVDPGEDCDDGNDVNGDGCENDCTVTPFCGDGNVDEGEECDDGNEIPRDGCEDDCTIGPVCGDGTQEAPEQCDDGNLIDGDGCESDCTVPAVCGDGFLGAGEDCDDGNVQPGDGCDAACAYEIALVITEVMQDPELVADSVGEWFEVHNPSLVDIDLAGYDFIDETGQAFTVAGEFIIAAGDYAVFGRNANPAVNGGIAVDYAYGAAMSLANAADRIVLRDAADLELDRVAWDGGQQWPNPRGRGRSMQFDANLNPLLDDNNVGANWCRPVTGIGNGEFGTPGTANDPCDAPQPPCGNGVIDGEEECDDGNVNNGDGCSALCRLEAVCGDGAVEANEECDDGNLVNNDGCDALCTNETFQQVAAESTRTSKIAAGSSDWFAFVVDDDSFYNFESYGAGGGCSGNTLFNLYAAADLENPIATDDDSGVGLCSLLQGPITPGNYVLQVTGSGGIQVPTYQLDFTLLVDATGGGQFTGATDVGGTDLYAFGLGAVSDLVVTVDNGLGGCPANFDSVVQLFELVGQNRTLVAENDDGGTNAPCSELVVVDLPAGNYYLFAGGKNGSALASHSVNVSFGDAPVCGDGTQDVGEECDDGNLIPGDGCSDLCETEATCGDFVFDDGEQCDDGNDVDGDGCSSICELETDCGDGVVEGVEQCDDNNVINGDGCSEFCRVEARLVITEVMVDPAAVGDFQGEWFEVHNPTPNSVDLQGWRFTDEANDDFTVDISVVVPAGGYALLARLYDPASNGNLDNVAFAYGLDMLHTNQRNDRIVMRNPAGVEIDRVAWTNNTWPNPQSNGRSYNLNANLDFATVDNNVGANWCYATTVMPNGDRGTPGAANNVCE